MKWGGFYLSRISIYTCFFVSAVIPVMVFIGDLHDDSRMLKMFCISSRQDLIGVAGNIFRRNLMGISLLQKC